jgi:hypothetical protein
MGFSFDSHLALSAGLLCAVAALAWWMAGGKRAGVRLNLRFAAVLFAALGVEGVAASWTSSMIGVAFAVSMLVMALGSVALTLSLFAPRPAPPFAASVALVAGLACGLASALMETPVFALVAEALSVAVMILLGLARFGDSRLAAVEIIAGGIVLLAAAMALLQGSLASASILFAAGLLGLSCASQMRVEQQADALFVQAIGRPRA